MPEPTSSADGDILFDEKIEEFLKNQVTTERTDELVKTIEKLQRENAQLKQKQEILQGEKKLLLTIMDNNPSLVFLKDKSGRYVYVNNTYKEQFIGYDDWHGKTDFDFWSEDSAELFRKHDTEVLKTGTFHQYLEDSKDKTGTRYCWLCYKFPVLDSKKNKYVGGIGIDVTARINAEEALKANEFEFRSLFDSMDEGYCIIEMIFDAQNKPVDYRFLKVNASFEKQTGLVNAVGKKMRDLAPEHEERWFEIYGKIALTGVPMRFENRADRLGRWYDVYAFRYGAPDKHQVGILFRDINPQKEAAEKLRQSEEKYRQLFESMNEGFFLAEIICDESGKSIDYRYLDANLSFERLTGLKREQTIGRTLRDLLPDAEDYWIETYGQVALTGQPARLENYAAPLGRHYETIAYSPRPGQFACLFVDITERKRTELALAAHTEELRRRVEEVEMLMEIAPVALWVAHDPQCNEIIGNRVANTFYEAGEQENVSANISNVRRFFHKGKELRPEELPMQVSAAMDVEIRNTELDVLTPSGKMLNILGSAIPLRTADGQVRGSVGAFVDITELKRTEEELRTSRDEFERRVQERTIELEEASEKILAERQRLLDVLETLPVVISLTRPDYRLEWVNKAYREALGDNTGLLCYASQFGYNEPCRECQAFRPLKTGQPHRWEWTLPNGHTFDIHNFPFMDTDGSPMILEMDIDITEQRRLEEQLRQSHKMEAIGTFAGGIAHDFNNILAAILGFTEMAIEDSSEHPLIERSLRNIHTSAVRGRDLVKQILAFSRKAAYERVAVSFSEIIKETVILLRASIPKTIEINLNINATSDTILASPTEIQQVVINLASNAAIAMEEKGRGILHIILSDADEIPDFDVFTTASEYIQLTVKDTGTGIERDVVNRIFDPFFTTRSQGKGTGMGLSVVYGIVNDLQGTITVESTPGIGSTFRVFLPKLNTDIDRKKARTPHIPTGTETILFIDDEELLAEWAKATLERLGYSVTATTDPAEALEMFASNPSAFDLVITDQSMPAIPGITLAKKIIAIRPDIPIILGTGHSAAVTPKIAKKAGIKEFVMKPIARPKLARIVRKTLDKYKKE